MSRTNAAGARRMTVPPRTHPETPPMPLTSSHCRAFGYDADASWAKLPPGIRWPEVAGVASDSRDNVFVFNRGPHPVLVFAPDGAFLRSWGEGGFVRPHGITIGPDDSVYCCDDSGHT